MTPYSKNLEFATYALYQAHTQTHTHTYTINHTYTHIYTHIQTHTQLHTKIAKFCGFLNCNNVNKIYVTYICRVARTYELDHIRLQKPELDL